MNPQRPSVYEAQVGENDNQCVWWIALDPSGFSGKRKGDCHLARQKLGSMDSVIPYKELKDFLQGLR